MQSQFESVYFDLSTKHYTNTMILLLILCAIAIAMLTAVVAVSNGKSRKRKAPKDVIRAMEDQGNEDDIEDDDNDMHTNKKID